MSILKNYENYPLALDKIEIKREILFDNQLKIADHYNIPIGNVKKLVPNFFDKETYVIHYENLQLYLKVQSCKLYNNKYMIASTQITNTEIFAFVAVLVFKLLARKVLFINRKDNRNC